MSFLKQLLCSHPTWLHVSDCKGPDIIGNNRDEGHYSLMECSHCATLRRFPYDGSFQPGGPNQHRYAETFNRIRVEATG